MVEDTELAGLNPFDLLDHEAGRIDAHLSVLPDTEWSRPSRCESWSIRDVLAHLLASEDYHAACLSGTVKAFLADLTAQGAADFHAINNLGVTRLASCTPQELLVRWRQRNAETRRRFRQRDGGVVDTSIGDYPCRWQAFHVASELAAHADDMFIPETAGEKMTRRGWRARFSRFALAEMKPDLVIRVHAGRTWVQGRGVDVEVDDHQLIEAAAGRLGDSLDPATRATLSTMP